MKMPGSSGVLTVSGDTRDVLQVFQLVFRAATMAQPTSTDALEAKGAAPAKKKQVFTQDKVETK